MIDIIVFFIDLVLFFIGISIINSKFFDGLVSFTGIVIFLIVFSLMIMITIKVTALFFLLSLIIPFIFSLLVFKNINWQKKTYIILLYQGFSIALISSIILIVRCFTDSEIVNYITDIAVNLVIVICLFILTQMPIKERINYILLFTSNGFKIYIVIALYFLSFSSMVVSFFPQTNANNTWYSLLTFTYVAILIIVALILPVLVSNNIAKNYYKNLKEIEDEQIRIQSDYYKRLIENNLELRRFKHDYNNQLIALQSFIDTNDIDAAKLYLKKSNEHITKLDIYHTGNNVLDALLDDKNCKAHEHNTEIEFSGNIFPSSIDDADLCIIFGNAIDNAIEACGKIKSDNHNIISIVINQKKHLMSILISNPVSTSPEIEDNMIVTSKKDTYNHGFGLYSIKRTVKKYNGDFDISCTNNIFSIKICLSIN